MGGIANSAKMGSKGLKILGHKLIATNDLCIAS